MNEPAFPNPRWEGWGEPQQGMTLRDYFAAKAMQGIISKMPFYLDEKQDLEKILNAVSRGSYSYADAMLKARKQ